MSAPAQRSDECGPEQPFRDGAIVRWWDYWDLQTLMGAAPAWWIEHVAQGYT